METQYHCLTRSKSYRLLWNQIVLQFRTKSILPIIIFLENVGPVFQFPRLPTKGAKETPNSAIFANLNRVAVSAKSYIESQLIHPIVCLTNGVRESIEDATISARVQSWHNGE